MSPRQLIEKLESLGGIDPKVLQKIRAQVENTDKKIKTSSILRYLVKKDQLTEQEAANLLKPEKAKPKADDFDVNLPPQEKEYDTSELTGLAPDPEDDVGATVMDQGQFLSPAEDAMDVDEVVEIQPAIEHTMEVEPVMEVSMVHDGLGGFEEADGAFPDDGGFGETYGEPAGSQKSTVGFVGKKNLKDQWSTKWLYIGFGILGFLLIMGVVLSFVVSGQSAEDQYDAAMDSFKKNSFRDAIAKFERYIEQHPSHEFVPNAKARRVQCIIASADQAKSWTDAIESAQTLLPELEADEDNQIEKIREDLGVMLPRALMNITDKGRKVTDLEAMKKELAKAKDYKKVVDNPVYIPASIRKKPTIAANLSRIDNNVAAIQGQIDKEIKYNEAIVEIRRFGDAGDTDKAFAAFRKLVRNYGDLAEREELVATMVTVSQKEQELVKPVELSLSVANADRPSPIQSTVVLATRSGEPSKNLAGEIANFLAEGSVYGIDAGDGKIVWRHFVGFQTSIQPQALDQDSLLVSNEQNHDLLLLKRRTGDVIWRTEIGEPYMSPAFDDAQIVVTTESGKVIRLNRQTGNTESAIQLPQPANVGAMVAEREQLLYQPGSYSNIYVLSKQDLTCKGVFYLGHYKNSIVVPPQQWLSYVMVMVNGGDYCDLYVLKAAENGVGLDPDPVQVLRRITNGPVSLPMQQFGRWRLLTADNGEIRILELDQNDEKNPVRTFASDQFNNSSGQPPFVLTEGSNLWIASDGISRFRIKRAVGKFDRDDIVDNADTFLTPLQKLDQNILHVRRRIGSGMLSASLVDEKTMQAVWRTDFGGELAGSPLPAGNAVTAFSNQGDLFQLDQSKFNKHYADTAGRSSTVVEDLKFKYQIAVDDDTVACFGVAGSEEFLYAKPLTGQNKLTHLSPPANQLANRPIVIGSELVIATRKGEVVRIDPTSGRIVGTPFLPPTSASSPTEWFEPVLIGDGTFAVASGNGSEDKNQSHLYLLDGSDRNQIVEIGSMASESPFKSRLAVLDQTILGVIESENNDQLVSIPIGSSLSIKSTFDLPGRVVDGPWLVDAGVLLKMDNDHLVLLSMELQTKWSVPVPNDQFAGNPGNVGSQILLTYRSGKMAIVDPASGDVTSQYDLGQPIIHAPTRVGQLMYFAGSDGTVHLADLNKISQ